MDYPKYADGYAIECDEEEIAIENTGYTNPNLHRRIVTQLNGAQIENQETAPRQYMLGVFNLNSYLTTRINYHDEESTTSEVP